MLVTLDLCILSTFTRLIKLLNAKWEFPWVIITSHTHEHGHTDSCDLFIFLLPFFFFLILT